MYDGHRSSLADAPTDDEQRYFEELGATPLGRVPVKNDGHKRAIDVILRRDQFAEKVDHLERGSVRGWYTARLPLRTEVHSNQFEFTYEDLKSREKIGRAHV